MSNLPVLSPAAFNESLVQKDLADCSKSIKKAEHVSLFFSALWLN